MVWAELYNSLHEYMNKIITEDITMLTNKKKTLDTIEWQLFIEKYKEKFVNNNRLLFEILIKEQVPLDQVDEKFVKKTALQFSHDTLTRILQKTNLFSTTNNLISSKNTLTN